MCLSVGYHDLTIGLTNPIWSMKAEEDLYCNQLHAVVVGTVLSRFMPLCWILRPHPLPTLHDKAKLAYSVSTRNCECQAAVDKQHFDERYK